MVPDIDNCMQLLTWNNAHETTWSHRFISLHVYFRSIQKLYDVNIRKSYGLGCLSCSLSITTIRQTWRTNILPIISAFKNCKYHYFSTVFDVLRFLCCAGYQEVNGSYIGMIYNMTSFISLFVKGTCDMLYNSSLNWHCEKHNNKTIINRWIFLQWRPLLWYLKFRSTSLFGAWNGLHKTIWTSFLSH